MRIDKHISPTVFPILCSTYQNKLLGKETIVSEMRIIKAVASVYGLEIPSILKRDSRKRGNVEPRQMIMLFARMYTKLMLREIGGLFDKPYDHSSVMHNIETVQNDIKQNEQIKDRYQQIELALFEERTIKDVKA